MLLSVDPSVYPSIVANNSVRAFTQQRRIVKRRRLLCGPCRIKGEWATSSSQNFLLYTHTVNIVARKIITSDVEGVFYVQYTFSVNSSVSQKNKFYIVVYFRTSHSPVTQGLVKQCSNYERESNILFT
jgi:hypothetical protein